MYLAYTFSFFFAATVGFLDVISLEEVHSWLSAENANSILAFQDAIILTNIRAWWNVLIIPSFEVKGIPQFHFFV